MRSLSVVERGFDGIQLTPMQMAKFGQLYLQGGGTSLSNDERVISQEWIDASFTAYTTTDDPMVPGEPVPYGFMQWYKPFSRSTVAVAEGRDGQYVCVDRDLGRVVIQQRDQPDSNGSDGHAAQDEVLNFVVEGSLSFHATNAGGLTGMTSESVESE